MQIMEKLLAQKLFIRDTFCNITDAQWIVPMCKIPDVPGFGDLGSEQKRYY